MCIEFRVVEDLSGNASATDGWVRVKRAHENLDLAVKALLLLGGGGEEGKSADALTVESLLRQVSGYKGKEEYEGRTMFLAKD